MLELLVDSGAANSVDLDRVGGVIANMLDTKIELNMLGDSYAKYQVDDRVNPQAIASGFAPRTASTPPRIVLTNYDLKPPGLNFAFGATWEGVVSVISTHRLKGDDLLTGVVALHELFHQFGMVSPDSPQYDGGSGMTGHCRNRCLMRPVNNLAELKAVANDWRRGVRMCSQCIA